MNKAITEGLALMPPEFSQGLNLWSREDGLMGQGSYLAQPNAGFVPNDQDFGGCLELEKTAATQKLRCFQAIPFQPGLYLRVTAKVKAISGTLPSVRIAGWAGASSGANVTAADQLGDSVALTTYGEVVTVSAIVGSGNRMGVDMVWGTAPVLGHFGLDLTGGNGGVVRIDDITIEDVSQVFHSVMFDWVDVRDHGAVGDGVTDDRAAFNAADVAAAGKSVVVPPGTYFIGSHLAVSNPIRFEGTLVMDAATRLTLTRNYDLSSYAAAMGTEEAGFRKGFQALFYFTDHVEFSLSGRRVELTQPIDVAALAALTSFEQRRVLSDGQLVALAGAAWNTTTVTATGTYATTNSGKLTGVTNIASIPVGAHVTGTGVGREVYVKSVNIATQTITLSKPLYGGNSTRSYTFKRYKYMFDFSNLTACSKFEMKNIEFICDGICSCIMLAQTGQAFRLTDSTINRARDRGITSIGTGCQDLRVSECEFISNEMSVDVVDRTTVLMNINANDTKIRNNRAIRFGHTIIASGAGHVFAGNHFFQGDDSTAGIRRASLVFTLINLKSFVTGNYIDNSYIELTNEHDNDPDFASEFTFGGLTVTGNVFTANEVAPSFRWLVVTPYGTGHSVQGLSVTNNVFRSLNGAIDRIEAVDTSFAILTKSLFKNITFTGNTFDGVTTPAESPILIEHSQATEAATWTVDTGNALPFQGRARNVTGLVFEGAVTNSGGAAQYVQPYVVVEQGSNADQAQIRWPSAVKGKAQVTLRVDNPV